MVTCQRGRSPTVNGTTGVWKRDRVTSAASKSMQKRSPSMNYVWTNDCPFGENHRIVSQSDLQILSDVNFETQLYEKQM